MNDLLSLKIDYVHVGLLILTIVGSALCVWRVMHDGDQFDAYGFFLGGGIMWSVGSGAATVRDKFLQPTLPKD